MTVLTKKGGMNAADLLDLSRHAGCIVDWLHIVSDRRISKFDA